MKKKIKDGTLYFRQKDIWRPLGTALLIAGLVTMYFGWNFSYLFYIVGSVFLPVGLVMFFAVAAKGISDSDITEQIDHAMLGYDKSVTNMDGYERTVLKQPAPVETSAYCFGSNARYFKKAKNGTTVSDIYTRARLFFTKDSLLIAARTVSISELNEETGAGITDISEQFPIAAIRTAALEEHTDTVTLTSSQKPVTVKWCDLVIGGEEGEWLRLTVGNDMDMASACDYINHRNGVR